MGESESAALAARVERARFKYCVALDDYLNFATWKSVGAGGLLRRDHGLTVVIARGRIGYRLSEEFGSNEAWFAFINHKRLRPACRTEREAMRVAYNYIKQTY